MSFKSFIKKGIGTASKVTSFTSNIVAKISSPIVSSLTGISKEKLMEISNKFAGLNPVNLADKMINKDTIKQTLKETGVTPTDQNVNALVDVLQEENKNKSGELLSVNGSGVNLSDKIQAFWNKGILYKFILVTVFGSILFVIYQVYLKFKK